MRDGGDEGLGGLLLRLDALEEEDEGGGRLVARERSDSSADEEEDVESGREWLVEVIETGRSAK